MKIGYEIQIQKDLSEEQKKLAKEYIDDWITWPNRKGDSCWKTGKAPSYFRRNVLGWVINKNAHPDDQIVFRRISKNRRIFGVVKLSLLKFKKHSDLKKYIRYPKDYPPDLTKGCRCDSCTNAYYVSMPTRPQMETYYTFGEIKG